MARFNARVKRGQLENSLSYCVLAANYSGLKKPFQAICGKVLLIDICSHCPLHLVAKNETFKMSPSRFFALSTLFQICFQAFQSPPLKLFQEIFSKHSIYLTTELVSVEYVCKSRNRCRRRPISMQVAYLHCYLHVAFLRYIFKTYEHPLVHIRLLCDLLIRIDHVL